MNIGAVIQENRRKKGYTQEQLADLVGVSAPAVSKWESNASCPDIALLAPIARALGVTIDHLLDFSPALTDEEVNALEQECAAIFEREGYESGRARCEALLHEYPNTPYLEFRVAALYQRFCISAGYPEEDFVAREMRRAVALLRQVYDSGDVRLHAVSASVLATVAITDGELDRAEALLAELPQTEVDVDTLYPLLYFKRGEREKAVELLEKRAFRAAGQLTAALNLLATTAAEDGDSERALACCRAAATVTEVLDIQDVYGMNVYLYQLAKRERWDEAAELAVRYLHKVRTLDFDYSGHPFLSHVKLSARPEQLPLIKRIWLDGFEREEAYAALREDTRVKAELERLRETIGQ